MAKAPHVFETAFDTYKVERVIGEGGSGQVFAVVDSEGKRRAVKCLSPQLSNTQKNKRFKNEIDFCSKQTHPNIVKVIDSGAAEWNGIKVPFYVMPHYRETLRNLLDKRIPADRVLRSFAQMLDGVEAAHLFKVTHRDLKPENVLYDDEKDQLVIADFGIAHFEEELILTAVETRKADKLANLRYAAPEQCARGTPVDSRADIYALGLLLNEMFTGATPRGTGYATIASIAPDLRYLDALVERMIQQSPGARPASLGEVKADLISRKNEFVAHQVLDAKRREVVPAAKPGEVQRVDVVGKD
jgi:eukaryotic-like serine/threonine-protein kinase